MDSCQDDQLLFCLLFLFLFYLFFCEEKKRNTLFGFYDTIMMAVKRKEMIHPRRRQANRHDGKITICHLVLQAANSKQQSKAHTMAEDTETELHSEVTATEVRGSFENFIGSSADLLWKFDVESHNSMLFMGLYHSCWHFRLILSVLWWRIFIFDSRIRGRSRETHVPGSQSVLDGWPSTAIAIGEARWNMNIEGKTQKYTWRNERIEDRDGHWRHF